MDNTLGNIYLGGEQLEPVREPWPKWQKKYQGRFSPRIQGRRSFREGRHYHHYWKSQRALHFRGLRGSLFLSGVSGSQSSVLLAQPYFLPRLQASPTSLNVINIQKLWEGNTAIILYFWTLSSNWGNNSLLAKVRLNVGWDKSKNKRTHPQISSLLDTGTFSRSRIQQGYWKWHVSDIIVFSHQMCCLNPGGYLVLTTFVLASGARVLCFAAWNHSTIHTPPHFPIHLQPCGKHPQGLETLKWSANKQWMLFINL